MRYISLSFQNLIPVQQKISDLCQLQIQYKFDLVQQNLQIVLYLGGFSMVLIFLVVINLGGKNFYEQISYTQFLLTLIPQKKFEDNNTVSMLKNLLKN